MKLDIEKAIKEVKLVTAALGAMNEQLQCLLYDLRHNAGLCVECGKSVEEQGEEYCAKCYDEAWKIQEDLFRDLQQDQKVTK